LYNGLPLYCGEFNEGKYHGIGFKGNVFDGYYYGEFRHDNYHGYGTLNWPSINRNETYTGKFERS
jgi:hypothetical protein